MNPYSDIGLLVQERILESNEDMCITLNRIVLWDHIGLEIGVRIRTPRYFMGDPQGTHPMFKMHYYRRTQWLN